MIAGVFKRIVIVSVILLFIPVNARASDIVNIAAITNDSVSFKENKYIYAGVPLDSINNKVYSVINGEYTPIYGNTRNFQYKLGDRYIVLSDNTILDVSSQRTVSDGMKSLMKRIIDNTNRYITGIVSDVNLVEQNSFSELFGTIEINGDKYIVGEYSKPIKHNGDYKVLCNDTNYVYIVSDGRVIRLSKDVDTNYLPKIHDTVDINLSYIYSLSATVINSKLFIVDKSSANISIYCTDFNKINLVQSDMASDFSIDINGNIWYASGKTICKYDGDSKSLVSTVDEDVLGVDAYDSDDLCYWTASKYYSSNSQTYGAVATEKYDSKSVNWSNSNGKYTYTKSNGSLAKDEWVLDNNNWYYFSNTSMVTGWFKDSSGNWYMLGPTGKMQKGWYNHANGEWYYLDSNTGVLQTGWLYVNNDWYYLRDDYSMSKGWFEVNNKVYHASSKGCIDKSIIIDGYVLDSSGAVIGRS